jgi:hypothetical protein
MGPFGRIAWPSEVDAWTRRSLDVDLPPDVRVHRAAAYAAVVEYSTRERRWFFKGLPSDRANDVTAAAWLATLAPEFTPVTIARSIRPDGSIWSLAEGCSGSPLDTCSTPGTGAALAATAFARIQQRAAAAAAGAPSIARVQFRETAFEMATLVEAALGSDAATQVAAVSAAIGRIASDLPASVVLTDFDPANVLVGDGTVRFIDVEDCMLGPAALAIAIFIRRLARRGIGCGVDLWDAYEGAWTPPLDLRAQRRALETMAALVECQLDWRRVVAKTDCGEVEGLLDAARRSVAARIVSAVSKYRMNAS